jgi:hypothetical protein
MRLEAGRLCGGAVVGFFRIHHSPVRSVSTSTLSPIESRRIRTTRVSSVCIR